MSEPLVLDYDLYSLPTAQHRAGLAGFLVHLRGMERRGLGPLPEVVHAEPGEVRVRLTPEALQATLNHLYEATAEEIQAKALRKKGRKGEEKQVVEPLRTETRSETDAKGRTKERTVYIYPQVVPGAPFLAALDVPDIWLKLWREAVWSTLRGIPKTRIPFEQRAEGAAVGEAHALWTELGRWRRAREHGRVAPAEVASSLFIGAQSANAERVPFRGSPDLNLLLHFWPVVMGVAEARRLQFKDGQETEEGDGFVLAVPDVSDIEWFVEDFERAAGQLDPRPHGYRPAAGVVALPQESALEYLHYLWALASARGIAGQVKFSVSGVEAYHLRRDGNSVHLLGVGRVVASPKLAQGYERIREMARSPLFRRRTILNLLHDEPWYAGFERDFSHHDWRMFLRGQFAGDARRRLAAQSGGRESDD